MTGEEAQLYRQLAALSGGPAVAVSGGVAEGDPEPSDAELEATIEELIREDQQEALYAQLEALGSR